MRFAAQSSVVAALCTALAIPVAAYAKWNSAYADAPANIVQWYAEQYNAKGQWCCDKADGHPFYDEYTLDNNGDVEFDFAGTHYHLPAYMILQGANPTGHAVWWYVVQADGEHLDYCFAPGAGG